MIAARRDIHPDLQAYTFKERKMTGLPGIAASIVFTSVALAQPAVLLSLRTAPGASLDTDPTSAAWQNARPVILDRTAMDQPAGRRTEVRSRWTNDSLQLLFVSSYQSLNLKPNPDAKNETNQLWNWDVAEAFLGSDFKNIRRYKEFEVSPQGEWVDLDINLDSAKKEDGWTWNSGFRTAVRIDRDRKLWIAVMDIPWKSIASETPAPGMELRANFYRTEGAAPNTIGMSWRPTHKRTFHAPEAFGILRLADESGMSPKK